MTAGLTSWRDGVTTTAITDFVARVTAERRARLRRAGGGGRGFDNDGTLWCEKPMPIQLDFTVQRLAQLAEDDAALRDRQPYKASREHDLRWMGAAMIKHYHGDDAT